MMLNFTPTLTSSAATGRQCSRSVKNGNDTPFVDKQLRKTIYTRTRLKNKIHRNDSKENKMSYKKQIIFFLSLRRKCMKSYLKKLTGKGLTTNESFGVHEVVYYK